MIFSLFWGGNPPPAPLVYGGESFPRSACVRRASCDFYPMKLLISPSGGVLFLKILLSLPPPHPNIIVGDVRRPTRKYFSTIPPNILILISRCRSTFGVPEIYKISAALFCVGWLGCPTSLSLAFQGDERAARARARTHTGQSQQQNARSSSPTQHHQITSITTL